MRSSPKIRKLVSAFSAEFQYRIFIHHANWNWKAFVCLFSIGRGFWNPLFSRVSPISPNPISLKRLGRAEKEKWPRPAEAESQSVTSTAKRSEKVFFFFFASSDDNDIGHSRSVGRPLRRRAVINFEIGKEGKDRNPFQNTRESLVELSTYRSSSDFAFFL